MGIKEFCTDWISLLKGYARETTDTSKPPLTPHPTPKMAIAILRGWIFWAIFSLVEVKLKTNNYFFLSFPRYQNSHFHLVHFLIYPWPCLLKTSEPWMGAGGGIHIQINAESPNLMRRAIHQCKYECLDMKSINFNDIKTSGRLGA